MTTARANLRRGSVRVALGLGLGLGLPNPRLNICNEKGHIRALCEPLEKQVRRLTVHYLIRAGLHYKDGRVLSFYLLCLYVSYARTPSG